MALGLGYFSFLDIINVINQNKTERCYFLGSVSVLQAWVKTMKGTVTAHEVKGQPTICTVIP